MTTQEFARQVLHNLPYVPNDQQVQLIAALSHFCSRNTPSDSVFMLNGYAGTGKTSLTGALVKTLSQVGIPSVLLAPTGRAAKVFASYSGHPAYTIHRMIYRSSSSGAFTSITAVAENRFRGAVFIIDEASMIGSASDSGNNLLEDLIHYVYSGEGCRMILLGDVAQLPPVGCEESPALSVKELRSYGLRVTRAMLTQTARQAESSGILYNATWLRRAMRAVQLPAPRVIVDAFEDVSIVSSIDLPEEMSKSYAQDGEAETILITRSNWRAVKFNQAIRAEILYREEILSVGERLLISKNNYFWSKNVKGLDFIANGDVATVTRVYGTEPMWGMYFADVALHFDDHDIDLDAKVFLSSLTAESPGLPPERFNEFYNSMLRDPNRFAPETSLSARQSALKKDPYVNALQVKYAYAVTCHKAQGGQWRNVYVDLAQIPPEAQGLDFYRWLYTAETRATGHLYFIDPTLQSK